MQQYQNPNFYGQQFMQPQFNPYLQRMENLQQFQQAIQQPMVPTSMSGANQFNPFGKIVESMDVVKVTDIPMDGNMYYFPQADGQAIYGKKFLPNGQTQILAYKPILDDNPNTLSQNEEKFDFGAFNEFTDTFKEQLNTLTDKIDKIEKYLKPTSKKKEVDE
jgi:hypothetical protein